MQIHALIAALSSATESEVASKGAGEAGDTGAAFGAVVAALAAKPLHTGAEAAAGPELPHENAEGATRKASPNLGSFEAQIHAENGPPATAISALLAKAELPARAIGPVILTETAALKGEERAAPVQEVKDGEFAAAPRTHDEGHEAGISDAAPASALAPAPENMPVESAPRGVPAVVQAPQVEQQAGVAAPVTMPAQVAQPTDDVPPIFRALDALTARGPLQQASAPNAQHIHPNEPASGAAAVDSAHFSPDGPVGDPATVKERNVTVKPPANESVSPPLLASSQPQDNAAVDRSASRDVAPQPPVGAPPKAEPDLISSRNAQPAPERQHPEESPRLNAIASEAAMKNSVRAGAPEAQAAAQPLAIAETPPQPEGRMAPTANAAVAAEAILPQSEPGIAREGSDPMMRDIATPLSGAAAAQAAPAQNRRAVTTQAASVEEATPPSPPGQIDDAPHETRVETSEKSDAARGPTDAPRQPPTIAPIQPAAPITAAVAEVSIAEASAEFGAIEGTSASRSEPVQTQLAATTRVEIPARIAAQLVDVARAMPDRPVEIALNPEELGRVRMTLQSVESSMTVTLAVERAETAELMRRHIDMLASEFRDLGYRDVTFNFSRQGQGDAQDHPAAHHTSNPASAEAPRLEDPAPIRLALDGSGGMDLRL